MFCQFFAALSKDAQCRFQGLLCTTRKSRLTQSAECRHLMPNHAAAAAADNYEMDKCATFFQQQQQQDGGRFEVQRQMIEVLSWGYHDVQNM